MITALFDRADNVVSNEKDKIEEKHHILAALQQNGYPKEFIQRTVKKHHRRKKQPRERPEEPKQTKSITYLTSKDSASSLNDHSIGTTSKQHSTPRQPSEVYLSKPTDHIPKEDRNNAVYQLNCKDCEAVYVGETKRTLNIRAEEHITAIKSPSKKSHTAEHCCTNMTLTGNIRKYWTLRKIGKHLPSRSQSTQRKTSIISIEYPSNCQISGNQYYEKAKQRKQPPKLQHHQTDSAKVRQPVWFRTMKS